MKKLMFAAAVAAIGTAFAVESGNIVGYQQKATRQGKEMITPTFQVVGGERGVWLSDLVPEGFLNNSDMFYDGQATFNIQIRDTNGKVAKDNNNVRKSYTWTRTFDVDKWVEEAEEDAAEGYKYWNNDGHWNDGNGDPITAHDASSDVFFPAGTGLWLDAPGKSSDDASAVYSITFNGQVNTNDCRIVFKQGKNPTGNMFPVGIKLSSLVPTGYLENSDMFYDGQASFNIQILAANGKVDTDANSVRKSYTWTQTFDVDAWVDETEEDAAEGSKYWNNDGHWNDGNGNAVVANGANDPTFNPSQGLWIDAPGKSSDDASAEYSITFKFPSAQ